MIYEKKETVDKLIIQTKKTSSQEILLALGCLNECYSDYEKSINQRFLVELCIMQLCSMSDMNFKKKLLIPAEDNKIIENNSNEQDVSLDAINEHHLAKTAKEEGKELKTKGKSEPNQRIKIEQKHIKSDLISISEELDSIDEKSEIKEKLKNQNWNNTDLLKTWQIFSKKLKETKKTNLHNIFERHLPKKNENELIIEVVSLSEKSEILEIKTDLLEFCKKELQNDFIKIVVNLSKEESKNMLHTKEEKYKHIVEQNHKVQLLQKKLNLNII